MAYQAPLTLSRPKRSRACAPRYHCTDNQAELLPRLRAALALRDRQAAPPEQIRALYAGCDRAPLNWENRNG